MQSSLTIWKEFVERRKTVSEAKIRSYSFPSNSSKGPEKFNNSGLYRVYREAVVDHKGHEDRRILTEGNEANEGCGMLSQIQAEEPSLPSFAFCKISSVFVAFVIFPYCANLIGYHALKT